MRLLFKNKHIVETLLTRSLTKDRVDTFDNLSLQYSLEGTHNQCGGVKQTDTVIHYKWQVVDKNHRCLFTRFN